MKKLSIYYTENTNQYEVSLFDLNHSDITVFNQSELTYNELISTIETLITEYNLSSDTIITSYIFDSNGFTKQTHKETLGQFIA